jgi:hypothetical protein
MTARRALPFALAALLTASVAAAQPIVRVVVRPAGLHLVGQQVQIDVQVLVPNFFMSAPSFPPIDMPGAVVTMPDDSGVNLNDTIKGESYAGVQKTYLFVAQAAGKYTLPPAPIAFTYAREPGKPADASVTLPPTVIEVDWPAGKAPPADGASTLVAAITIEQTLDRDPGTLLVGDALTRTIVTTAERTQAMFIQPPAFPAPDGVGVYRKDPVLQDERTDRVGLVAGHRTDRAVYTFDTPGSYVLPAFELPWFDARNNRQQIARAEAVQVTVAAAPAPASAIAPEPPPAPVTTEPESRFNITLVIVGAGAVLLLAWAVRRVVVRALQFVLGLCALAWAAVRRDRARHLPPLNPASPGKPGA